MTNEAVPPVPAVQTYSLTRMYGTVAALQGLDLTVNRGDLFGFIGSNGAGKTTTLRILATFLAPSAGRALVLGHDVVHDADAVRHVIGYMKDFLFGPEQARAPLGARSGGERGRVMLARCPAPS